VEGCAPSLRTMLAMVRNAPPSAPIWHCTRTFIVSSGFVTTVLTTPAAMPAARCTGVPAAASGTRRARNAYGVRDAACPISTG
jgi:hypothetical protein